MILASAFLLVFCLSHSALATSFSVGPGGSLTFGGFGFGDYDVTAYASNFDLNAGQTSSTIKFFDVTFHDLALGAGNVDATIELSTPTPESLDDSGFYWGLSFFGLFTVGEINWGDPIEIAYGNGGLLELDLYDVGKISCGPAIAINGTIKNITAASVPEPATMMLLGTGLIGLAVIGRKKFFK